MRNMRNPYSAILSMAATLIFIFVFDTHSLSGAAIAAHPVSYKAVLKGKVLEVDSVRPGFLGLSEERVLYRLVVLVEETEDIEGSPNSLRGKEGRQVTFFSEEKQASELSGKRIKALVEYRGDRKSRLFWITHIEVME